MYRKGAAPPSRLSFFGAPYFDTDRLFEALGEKAILREPCFGPAASSPPQANGRDSPAMVFQIHVTDPAGYRPYGTALRLLRAVLACHKDAFAWKPPPYEYEYERMPIDLILGDAEVRRRIELLEGRRADGAGQWEEDLAAYAAVSQGVRLYP